MGDLIKSFGDGAFLEYDRGCFDEWCVYMTNSNGQRKAPRDADYFSELTNLASKHGTNKVYGDYATVYELTGKQIDQGVLATISSVASTYGEDALEMDKILSILYMAMIAEERRAYTRLGKRIKRLGVHKLLIEGVSVQEAANFMRGMNWKEIDQICKEIGF